MESKTSGLVDTFNSLTANRLLVVEDIRLSIALDRGISQLHVIDMDHDGSVFTVEGQAVKSGSISAETLIFDFATELRNTGLYQQVIVSSIVSSLGEGGTPTETLTFTLILIK